MVHIHYTHIKPPDGSYLLGVLDPHRSPGILVQWGEGVLIFWHRSFWLLFQCVGCVTCSSNILTFLDFVACLHKWVNHNFNQCAPAAHLHSHFFNHWQIPDCYGQSLYAKWSNSMYILDSGFSASLQSEGTMFWPRIHVQKKPTDRSKQHSVVFLYLTCWKFHDWFFYSWALKTMTNFVNKKKEPQFSWAQHPHQNWIPASAKSRINTRSKFTSTFWTLAPAWLQRHVGLKGKQGFPVVGRKGKQWWVKPTLSWTYDPNMNQGKGSTMKQYLVVEVCRRGIDTASLYISIEAKHDVYIYPGTTIFKTHTNHHSWCQLDTKRKDPYFLLAGHPLFRPTLPKDTYDNDTSQISLPYTILYVNYMMPFPLKITATMWNSKATHLYSTYLKNQTHNRGSYPKEYYLSKAFFFLVPCVC